jgi:membrane-associated phospholipid phosphatase
LIIVRQDEIVRGGYSYYSGHSSGLFAAVTPMIWAVKNPKLKLFFFGWATLHAFSRIYLAAHYPFCVLIGSIAGFIWGTLVVICFKIYRPINESESKNNK